MARLVDSSVLVSLERGNLPLTVLFDSAPDEETAIAAITASELLVGIYRANSPEHGIRREVFVEEALADLPIVAFDLAAARAHARLMATMSASGQIIGSHDLLIAATALANNYDVLTTNVRDFSRVPGLVVREPTW